MRSTILAIAAAILVSGCVSSPDPLSEESILSGGRAPAGRLERLITEADRHPLGSQQNPVRVNMPPGQRAYLSRLRCSDGAAPAFYRIGNGGPGVFGSIVDIYDVTCASGEPRRSQIWMDMYHPQHNETRAVPGFRIVP